VIDQLSKLEDLTYYMMDVYQVNASDCSFTNMKISTNNSHQQ
jgi:hypothetical protein